MSLYSNAWGVHLGGAFHLPAGDLTVVCCGAEVAVVLVRWWCGEGGGYTVNL